MRRVLMLGLLLIPTLLRAEEGLPPTNLIGLTRIQDQVSVSMTVTGAEHLAVDPSQLVRIVRDGLAAAHIATVGDLNAPKVFLTIRGDAWKDNGAHLYIEMELRAQAVSPFNAARKVDAAIWRSVATDKETTRYDRDTKALVNPTKTIKDRVYAKVAELTAQLAADSWRVAGP